MIRSRKRVVDAIEFNRPDRAPMRHLLLPVAILKHGERLLNIASRYPQDFGPSELAISLPFTSLKKPFGLHSS